MGMLKNDQEEIMLKKLLHLISGRPKARVRIIVRGILMVDDVMKIHEQIKSWKLPGWMQAVPGSHLTIEVEGSERRIREAIEQLKTRSIVNGYRMDINWLPFRGDLADFRLAA